MSEVTILEPTPTGRFVPVKVWSCPVHDLDTSFDEMWEQPGYVCLDCETGCWRDLKDAEGNVVMRELSSLEAMLHDAFERSPLEGVSFATRAMSRVEWLEDELLPRVSA